MSRLRALLSRAMDVLLARPRDDRFDEEVRTHLDLLTQEYAARGLAPAEARRAARRAFGGVEQLRDAFRDQRGLPFVDATVQDLRFACRLLRRDPAYAAAAVLVLGLGLGVNNMFFTILHAHTMRGLPITGADRVLALAMTDDGTRERALSRAEFERVRDGARSFSGLAAFSTAPIAASEDGLPPGRLAGAYVSAGLFSVIGARPVRGRDFTAADDAPGSAAVALLAEGTWRSRYGADPGILRRSVRLNGRPTAIVGVMPDRSGFPGTADVWLPLSEIAPPPHDAPEPRTLQVFGRLQPDATLAGARAEVDAIAARLSREQPETHRGVGARTVPINERYLGRLREPAWLAFMTAGCLIVLISCANVAILMLGRSSQRAREIAIRVSLGAGRARVVRQLLAEGTVLAALGAGAGLGVAIAAVRIFSSAIPERVLPYWFDYSLDARVLAALLGVSLAAVFLFALVPALHASRTDASAVLRGGGQIGPDRSGRRWTSALLAAELALAVVLLSHLAVALRSSRPPLPAEQAMADAAIVTAAVSLPPEQYGTPDRQHAFHAALGRRLEAIPGVVSSIAARLPLAGADERHVEVRGSPGDAAQRVRVVAIGPRYFEALGLTLPLGRELDARAGTPGYAHAVVNEPFVQAFLAGRDPLAARIAVRVGDAAPGEPEWMTIVGVAPAFRQRPGRDPDPVVFVPIRGTPAPTVMVIARSPLDTTALASHLREQAQAVDPHLPLYRVQPLRQAMRDADWNSRVSNRLFLFLTFIAVALATAGLFTATARSVIRRTPEIGLRMALGASTRDVVRLVAARAALQLAVGIAAGVACTRLWAWTFPTTIAGARTTDPASLLIVIGSVGVMGLLATVVPARRAARLDPLAALRQE